MMTALKNGHTYAAIRCQNRYLLCRVPVIILNDVKIRHTVLVLLFLFLLGCLGRHCSYCNRCVRVDVGDGLCDCFGCRLNNRLFVLLEAVRNRCGAALKGLVRCYVFSRLISNIISLCGELKFFICHFSNLLNHSRSKRTG